jgi:hypothetical protein
MGKEKEDKPRKWYYPILLGSMPALIGILVTILIYSNDKHAEEKNNKTKSQIVQAVRDTLQDRAVAECKSSIGAVNIRVDVVQGKVNNLELNQEKIIQNQSIQNNILSVLVNKFDKNLGPLLQLLQQERNTEIRSIDSVSNSQNEKKYAYNDSMVVENNQDYESDIYNLGERAGKSNTEVHPYIPLSKLINPLKYILFINLK